MASNLTPTEEKAIIVAYKTIIGRRGGLARSAQKAKQARRNGRLGGRPRKQLAEAR